jgi:hypothetical protein
MVHQLTKVPAADRPFLAVLGPIVDGPSSTHCCLLCAREADVRQALLREIL